MCAGFQALAGRFGMGRWMWGALNALQAVLVVLITAVGFPVALLLGLVSGSGAALRVASWYWAPLLFRGSGARLVVEGVEHVDWSRPQVLVANHQSMFDIPSLFAAVPVPLRFMLKRELAALPLIGWYASLMGMVFIDRGNARDAKRKLGDAADRLRDGATLIAFPEGTRGTSGAVGPFKGGALQVALEAGVPVVPVAIEGSGHVLPPSGFRVRPGTIRVRFGAPIDTAGMERNALAQQARSAIVGMLPAR
jgi:1-acyl-sn-glycerol-3-phosphate acyltransferase